MAAVITAPKIETPIVIPDGDQHTIWEWLKDQARSRGQAELIHSVKEQGNCDAQTVTKCLELAALLDIPLARSRFS